MSLQNRAAHGIFWSAIEKFSVQIIQFILGIILARLLTPSDYGLVGMLLIFLTVSEALIDSGFSSALIRLKAPTQKDYSTVFWFNMSISIVLYLILYLSSPAIANFYDQPLLVELTRMYMLVLVINATSAIHRTMLMKKIDFKSQTKVTMTSTFLGGLIGIFAALNGMGVFALVIQALSRALLSALLYWIKGKWVPMVVFSINSFKQCFNYGSKILMATIFNVISDNLYTMFIGRVYSSSSLGYYTRALQFKQLPIASTYGIMRRVTFPVLCELQDNNLKLGQAYSKFIKLISFTIFPVMALLIVLADPLILILLGSKWIESAHLLQIAALAGLTYPLSSINLNVMNVKGRSDLYLKLEILKNIFSITALVVTYKFGIETMLWGQVIVSLLAYYFNAYFVKKLIGYGFFSQIADVLKPLILTILSASVVFLLTRVIEPDLYKLIVGSLIGVSIYLVLFWFFASHERIEYLSYIKTKTS